MQWKTRDGKIMRPSEMETSHIENSIKLCKRRMIVLLLKYGWTMRNHWVYIEAKENLLRTMKAFRKELKKRKVEK